MDNAVLLTNDIEDTVRCVANVLADTTGERARVAFAFHTKVTAAQRWYVPRRRRRAISSVAAAVIAVVRLESSPGAAAGAVRNVTTKDMVTIPARLSAAARHVQGELARENSYQSVTGDDE